MTYSVKSVVEKYWKAANDRDWKTFEALIDDNIVYDLPQTRERIKGKTAFREFNENYPGDWTLSIACLVAEEHKAVSHIIFGDDNGDQTGISFFEIQNGVICRIEEYWPAPYDPPPRLCEHIQIY